MRILLLVIMLVAESVLAQSTGFWTTKGSQEVYYTEVIGEGRDVNQARENGFRIAVEQAVGGLVASSAEVQNGQLVRDEIVNYSSGYVTEYQIVQNSPGPMGVRTQMKVWVGRSKIANRLLNSSSENARVSGATAAVAIATTLRERQQGDRLLSTVLLDFPKRAFDIQIGRTQVNFNSDRSATLDVPIKIGLNKNFIKSLWEALEVTQNKNGNLAEITVKTPAFSGVGGTVSYADTEKYDMIARIMGNSKPMVKISFLNDASRVVYTTLYNMPALTHDGVFAGIPVFVDIGYYRPNAWFSGVASTAPYQLQINANQMIPATISIPVNSATLAQISQVNVEIVP